MVGVGHQIVVGETGKPLRAQDFCHRKLEPFREMVVVDVTRYALMQTCLEFANHFLDVVRLGGTWVTSPNPSIYRNNLAAINQNRGVR